MNEYNHDHDLIKKVYEERGWNHEDDKPTLSTTVEGENETKSFSTVVNKKINLVRRRIRKIKIIKIQMNDDEEIEHDNEKRDLLNDLDVEIEMENHKIRLLQKSKKFKKKVDSEKGGVKIPQSSRNLDKRPDFKQWKGAMDVEWQAFQDKDVLEPVLRSEAKGKNIVGVRWVYDLKLDKDQQTILKYKARLVARGFTQKYGVDYDDVFAPTMNIKTMRILLAIAARDNVNVLQYDVSAAFLHAKLEHDVYIEQPEGYDDPRYPRDKYIYKLKRAMYGLKNAGYEWSKHFMNILRNLGFVQNTKDDCLWTFRKGTSYIHYLFHVDDIMAVSNDNKLRDSMYEDVKKQVDIRNEGELSMFLGMNIMRMDDGSFTIDQSKYIEKIANRFGINDSKHMKKRRTPGDFGKKLTLEQLPETLEDKKDAMKYDMPALVGALIYTIRTRFDVSYAISDVSRFMSKWGVEHYKHAIRILEYLYQTRDMKIKINSNYMKDELKLTLYVDANYGDDREHTERDDKWKSQGGYVLFLGGALVSWVSRRHHIRVLSSMESEYIEASDAAKEVIWARQLLHELGYTQHEPTTIYEDNTACINFCKIGRISERTKHIDIKKYYLKEKQKQKLIEMIHVKTDRQLADMMTKYILVNSFVTMRDIIFNGIDDHDKYVNG